MSFTYLYIDLYVYHHNIMSLHHYNKLTKAARHPVE